MRERKLHEINSEIEVADTKGEKGLFELDCKWAVSQRPLKG